MRLRLASLAFLAACGSLALGTTEAGTIQAANSAGTAIVRADQASAGRIWPLILSPAPGDLALAEVSFHRAARGQAISPSSLQVSVSGPSGDDYLAVAVPRLQTPGAPLALVLLVNRPSALLDPVSVRVRLTARRALGAPLLRRHADPFTRPPAGRGPALCNLALHGSALSASELRPLHARGQALAGFDAASAVAQAYDAVCRLPFASSFEQAVEQASFTSPSPTPSTPSPAAPPAPPVGKLPGEGCVPTPGYACPGAVESSFPAVPVDAGRRAAAGAH